MVKIPAAALAQLDVARAAMIVCGEIWWIPEGLVVYRGEPKRRPCLVVALDPARAYLVPGTSGTASGPAVVVDAGETDLILRTEFDFSASFPLLRTDVTAKGKFAGAIATHRLDEIDAAIRASDRVALKRLVGP